MTFNLDIWRAGSPRHCIGHIRQSRSYVKVQDHRRNKNTATAGRSNRSI